jgi:hypothetical protein
MPDSQTLPPPQGPEYARCGACGHIEPEHRPDAGPCLVCDCAAYRTAAPTDEDFLVAVEEALESVLLPDPGIVVLERTRDVVTGALAPLVASLRRMAGEAQQPETQAAGWHLTREHLDLFVRALVNEVDYDIHKGYECGEEDGEDHYPELVAEAAEMLNAITAERQVDTAGERQ